MPWTEEIGAAFLASPDAVMDAGSDLTSARGFGVRDGQTVGVVAQVRHRKEHLEFESAEQMRRFGERGLTLVNCDKNVTSFQSLDSSVC